MNKNLKKLLCSALAVLCMTACNFGGEETNPTELPTQETTRPTVTLPKGEGVEEWDDPVETAPGETDPVQTTVPPEATTEPTENNTQGDTKPPAETIRPTDPQEQTPPETTQPQTGGYDPASLSYEEYLAMSPYEQQAHYEMFPNLESYIAWHNAALAEYEENQSSIEVTGGIDIGDFMNP